MSYSETAAGSMDDFLDNIHPNQYIRKAELATAGPFEVKNIHTQRSRQYDRDEYVISVSLAEDTTDMLRMISFGVGNTYIDAFVKQWQRFQQEKKDPGLFILVEQEKNRFRFVRP